jgi:hypothetical protein
LLRTDETGTRIARNITMNAMSSAAPTLLAKTTTAPVKGRGIKEQVVLVLPGWRL